MFAMFAHCGTRGAEESMPLRTSTMENLRITYESAIPSQYSDGNRLALAPKRTGVIGMLEVPSHGRREHWLFST